MYSLTHAVRSLGVGRNGGRCLRVNGREGRVTLRLVSRWPVTGPCHRDGDSHRDQVGPLRPALTVIVRIGTNLPVPVRPGRRPGRLSGPGRTARLEQAILAVMGIEVSNKWDSWGGWEFSLSDRQGQRQ